MKKKNDKGKKNLTKIKRRKKYLQQRNKNGKTNLSIYQQRQRDKKNNIVRDLPLLTTHQEIKEDITLKKQTLREHKKDFTYKDNNTGGMNLFLLEKINEHKKLVYRGDQVALDKFYTDFENEHVLVKIMSTVTYFSKEDKKDKEYFIYLQKSRKHKWIPWIVIAPSQLDKGAYGIFPGRDFKEGDILGIYMGKYTTNINREYGEKDKVYHFLNMNAESGVDGGSKIRMGMHLINSVAKKNETLSVVNNASIKFEKDYGVIVMKNLYNQNKNKNICGGKEILGDYLWQN